LSSEQREQRPVTALRGVGDALAARLAVLGVESVQDLLFVLPTRYEDRTRVQPIGSLLAGGRAVVEGEVQLAEVAFRRRRQLLCRIADGSGFLTLRFFHFSAGPRARHPPALLRRGAPRPRGPRDGAPGVPPHFR
jgi:ATP-dependent DNA helicase RecG